MLMLIPILRLRLILGTLLLRCWGVIVRLLCVLYWFPVLYCTVLYLWYGGWVSWVWWTRVCMYVYMHSSMVRQEGRKEALCSYIAVIHLPSSSSSPSSIHFFFLHISSFPLDILYALDRARLGVNSPMKKPGDEHEKKSSLIL
ncbi:hypothetical protein HOY80DRAFT_505295 [Tuber brumale]|nr:hypothetical protein HOY80DRAFT_505295 [Tuber brumale]